MWNIAIPCVTKLDPMNKHADFYWWYHDMETLSVFISLCEGNRLPSVFLRTNWPLMPDFHMSFQWRHNGRDFVTKHQPPDCFLNRLFRRRSKKTSKLRVTGLCAENSPGPVNSPHKWPATRKMFLFDDAIMVICCYINHYVYFFHCRWVALICLLISFSIFRSLAAG